MNIPVPAPPETIDIKLIGMQGTDDAKKRGQDHIVLYGIRTTDVANRVVGVGVPYGLAAQFAQEVARQGEMPIIEVPYNSWFHILTFGVNIDTQTVSS